MKNTAKNSRLRPVYVATKKEPQKRFSEALVHISSSGNRTRTCDLWVMSPTSYQLLHPAIIMGLQRYGDFKQEQEMQQLFFPLFSKRSFSEL